MSDQAVLLLRKQLKGARANANARRARAMRANAARANASDVGGAAWIWCCGYSHRFRGIERRDRARGRAFERAHASVGFYAP